MAAAAASSATVTRSLPTGAWLQAGQARRTGGRNLPLPADSASARCFTCPARTTLPSPLCVYTILFSLPAPACAFL